MSTDHGPPWTRNNGYETLDFMLVTQQWKNTVMDSETDTEGFIPSDHYPVTAKIKIKFRATESKQKMERVKYGTMKTEHKINYNLEINEELDKLESKPTMEQFLKIIRKAGNETAPRQPKKREREHISEDLRNVFEERENDAPNLLKPA